MVYLLSVKNVISVGKFIGLLLFCLPLLLLLLLSILKGHTKNSRNELVRLVMGTIFLVVLTQIYIHVIFASH